ncbi:MAG: fumarylacetoacetase [Pseudomonadota bacterium]|nr:fumarylacetoacetase [Pseudomonadota bacterium]
MTGLNETHDPALESWVEGANRNKADFPIQNLPFSVFRRRGSKDALRGCVAIGEAIVDLAALSATDVLSGLAARGAMACGAPVLNEFMAMGRETWSELRLALSRALRPDSTSREAVSSCLLPQDSVELGLPVSIGDYTDFFTSIYHATAVGSLFRPDVPLQPNYKWVPIAYHGRSSSIDVSGQAFKRPRGQLKAPDADQPLVGPSRHLDYELEIGIYIGQGNEPGRAIKLDDGDDYVFGLCLLNDWSARDVQAWEYRPLGPFLSKSFASTVSPWIVTLEALAPFRIPWTRPARDPQPLPYLDSARNRATGAFDINLAVYLQSESMRDKRQPPSRVSRSNYRHAYWSVAQMLAHHTINGCKLRVGDLFGSGTQSGPEREEAGSMLELSQGGKQSITLDNGETRTFLEDGDTVILRAWCEAASAVRIGFGEARGTVLPAES